MRNHPDFWEKKETKIKKILMLLVLCCSLLSFMAVAHAEINTDTLIYYNGEHIYFSSWPVSENGSTIVPVRDLSEAMGFDISWNGDKKRVDAFDDSVKVKMYIDNNVLTVEKEENQSSVHSAVPPRLINSVAYVPLRAVAEAFGGTVTWDSENNCIYIDNLLKKNTFYSQYDADYIEKYSEAPYNWTSGRNGYCYVTSYAMLLSDLTGITITPKDIADINMEVSGSPKSCYHGAIVGKYGKKLIPALDPSSAYYKSYDAGRGLTYIDNSSDWNVIAAIKEALKRNPKGVMVRDTSMPHTMVAVGYVGNTIYFNDPALQKGCVTWDKTCLRNRTMSTIVAIMAIE